MPRLKVLSKQVGVLRPVNRYGYIRAIKGPETYVYCRAETKDALYNNEGCKWTIFQWYTIYIFEIQGRDNLEIQTHKKVKNQTKQNNAINVTRDSIHWADR